MQVPTPSQSMSQFRRLLSLSSIMILAFVFPTKICGPNLAWGTINVYLTSYLNIYNSKANLSTVAMAPFVYGVSWSIGTSRLTIFLGIVLYAGGVAISSLFTDFYGFLLVFLFSLGFSCALIIIPSMFLSWLCLPFRKGLATGLTLLGYGFGGMSYGLIFTFIVNPENKTPDKEIMAGNQSERIFGEEIADRVPMALQETAGAIFVLGIAVVFFVIEAAGVTDRKALSSSITSKAVLSGSGENECQSIKEALGTSSIYVLFLYSWCSYCFPMIFLYQYKNYGQIYSSNDHLLSGIGTIGLFFNSIARLFSSWLIDYLPFRVVMKSVCLLLMITALTVQFIVQYEYIYCIWVCLIFAGHGCLYSPTALVCGEIYGSKMGAKVFSLASQGAMLSNFSMIPAVLLIFEVRTIQPFGYNIGFFVMGLMSGLAAVLLLFLRTKYTWESKDMTKPLQQ